MSSEPPLPPDDFDLTSYVNERKADATELEEDRRRWETRCRQRVEFLRLIDKARYYDAAAAARGQGLCPEQWEVRPDANGDRPGWVNAQRAVCLLWSHAASQRKEQHDRCMDLLLEVPGDRYLQEAYHEWLYRRVKNAYDLAAGFINPPPNVEGDPYIEEATAVHQREQQAAARARSRGEAERLWLEALERFEAAAGMAWQELSNHRDDLDRFDWRTNAGAIAACLEALAESPEIDRAREEWARLKRDRILQAMEDGAGALPGMRGDRLRLGLFAACDLIDDWLSGRRINRERLGAWLLTRGGLMDVPYLLMQLVRPLCGWHSTFSSEVNRVPAQEAMRSGTGLECTATVNPLLVRGTGLLNVLTIDQLEAASSGRPEGSNEGPPRHADPDSAPGGGADREAGEAPVPQYVTLDQVAALVNRNKKTLARRVNDPESNAPTPDVEGGGGKPHEWRWDRIRPWLEKEFGRQMPARFPSLC